jgi:choline-sulfatase
MTDPSRRPRRRRLHDDRNQECWCTTNAASFFTTSTRSCWILLLLPLLWTSNNSGVVANAATTTSATTTQRRPRGIIVLQADDLHFDERWTPAVHFADGEVPLQVDLPHLNRLRRNGIQLLRAYASSPMCGTSRYTTITGRYASRAASSRVYNHRENNNNDISYVKILTTKLADYDNTDEDTGVDDGLDCSRHNLAQVLRRHGYRTGVVGKWHLGVTTDSDSTTSTSSTTSSTTTTTSSYNYEAVQADIKTCGFDTAEAIYHENLSGDWTNNGAFTHNMEHLTIKAIEFMDDAVAADQDFFLYFNPTAPHESGNVYEALTQSRCTDTVEGVLATEPYIPTMTDIAGGCSAYRQGIIERAGGDISNAVLGAIWTDDAVGALLYHLETKLEMLHDTLIVFQMDHGKEGKGSLYEPGVRIAQFVHYPAVIAAGSTYAGLVSTIDVAPTLLDYAGVTGSGTNHYPMDGKSWKDLISNNNSTSSTTSNHNNRCIVTEDDYDRAVICQCEKYLEIGDRADSGTVRRGAKHGLLISQDESAFNLCDDDTSSYVTSPSESRETVVGIVEPPDAALVAMLECHNRMTDPNVTPQYGLCDSLLFRAVADDKQQQRQYPLGADGAAVPAPTLVDGGPTIMPTTALAMATNLYQAQAAEEASSSAGLTAAGSWFLSVGVVSFITLWRLLLC